MSDRTHAAEEALQEIIYVVSHDLPEPLRMVTSFLGLLERRYGEELDDDAKAFIAYAVDGAERLQAMLEGLLVLSRIETLGKPPEPTQVGAALDAALAELAEPIRSSGAEVAAEGRLPTVAADPAQLQRVLRELVANAITFVPAGAVPHVSIRAAAQDDGMWRLTVADDGVGVDPRHADRVTKIFQRLHPRDEYPGQGMGLAYVKRIVERHDGTVWLDSTPGAGSEFHVTFPAA